MSSSRETALASPWTWRNTLTHALAWALAVCTLPLLFVGASVTSYGVGMAVPDAPTTFGQNVFLYNFFEAPFGVQVEHVHRLLGYLVGFVAIGVTLGLFLVESTKGRRWLGALVLLAVVTQGLLGRYRVELNAQFGPNLATIHGCVGQLCFALMIMVIVVTSRAWHHPKIVGHAKPGPARWAAITLLVMVYSQIVLGAVFRHLDVDVGFILHLTLAFLLLTSAVGTLAWFASQAGYRQALMKPMAWVTALVVVQIFLGMGAALATQLAPQGMGPAPTHVTALIPSLHVMGGSLTLALSVVLALGSFRFLQPTVETQEQAPPTEPSAVSANHEKVGV